MQQEAEFGLAPVTPKKVEQGGGVLEHAVRCDILGLQNADVGSSMGKIWGQMLMLVHQWENMRKTNQVFEQAVHYAGLPLYERPGEEFK